MGKFSPTRPRSFGAFIEGLKGREKRPKGEGIHANFKGFLQDLEFFKSVHRGPRYGDLSKGEAKKSFDKKLCEGLFPFSSLLQSGYFSSFLLAYEANASTI